jgi:Domain of unknown function (DUF222)/HNH endonuclease
MLLGEVIELATVIDRFDVASSSLDETHAALASVTRLAGWLEARRLAMVGRIGELSSFPEKHIATATRSSQRDATKTAKRAATLARSPELAASLSDGNVTAGHVDAVTNALGHVDPAARAQLAPAIARLLPVAEHGTPAEFERAIRREVEAAELVDGEERLERQKRAARFRSWTDRETGMWRFAGQLDPENGLTMHALLERMMATLFADKVPEGCPTDPAERNDWLRAQAFIAIMNGQKVASGAPETVIVVDTRDSSIRWDLDVDLPPSAVQRFVDRSNVHFVDVHGDRINFADGNLNLGRTARVANRAQRRAKQAVHPTCVIPGCEVRFALTKLHHIIYWENGGLTDLANLTPVCVHHHTQIHQGTIHVRVGPNGELDITTNDTKNNGPPTNRAA